MHTLPQITHYLVAQSWQIAVLVLVVSLATFILRHKSAHIRYLLWLVVLAKCLVPPLLTVPLAVLPEEVSPDFPVIIAVAPETDEAAAVEPLPSSSQPADVSFQDGQGPLTNATQLPKKLTFYQWLALGWMVGGVLYGLAVVAQTLWYTIWLHKRRIELAGNMHQQVTAICSQLDIRILPKIWLVPGIAQPFVWGKWRGSLYLPESFFQVNTADHCRDILVHELSHVLRFDAAVNVLQVLVQGIFWFHPLVWWANHRIRTEREKCCDEMAIARLGSHAREYGKAIVNALLAEHESTRRVPSLAIAGPARNIQERIMTIMRPGREFHLHPSVMAALTIIVLALITVPTTLVLTSRAETEASGQLDQASDGVANEEIQEATSPSPHQTTQALLEAVKKDDIEQVKLLIAEGADVNGRAQNWESVLNHAVKTRNKDLVALLIDKGADIDARGYWGNAPLHLAAYHDTKDMTELLIEKGADVNIRQGGSNITPLHFSCFWHVTSIAELLIAKGADVNAKTRTGYTPLYWAIWNERFDNARLLVSHGADLDYVNSGDWAPLYLTLSANGKELVELMVEKGSSAPAFHLAAFRGELERVKSIYAGGADIDERDQINWTPLHWAASGGQSDIVEFLTRNGADVNAKGELGTTPLHLSARSGIKEMVALLLSEGANVNTRTNYRSKSIADNNNKNKNATPLHYASGAGHRAVVELLIANGADIEAKNGKGRTPLFEASTKGDVETVEFLIAKGADINMRDRNGQSILMEATEGGHSETVALLRQHGAKETLHDAVVGPGNLTMLKRLISEGCDINALGSGGRTPLFLAVRFGHKDMVEVLLNEGADVNIAPDIWPPLILATRTGKKEIAAMLLKKGADITAQDLVGLTAMGIAKVRGDTETVELLSARARQLDPEKEIMTIFDYVQIGDAEKIKSLIAAGQDVNTKTKNGEVALHGAAWRGRREIAELLIQNGADVNIQSKGGATPLWTACQRGKTEIVELLLANGADINVKNNAGKTALDIAREREHTEIVELLQKHGAK
jgi:ankyrin repeat protein/beta-lactamase regulating signal transducer with metallopeptidase domain